MNRLYIILGIVAVMVIGMVSIAAVGEAYTTITNGLEVYTQSYHGNNALIVKDTSGTAKVTITSAGDTTFAGSVTTSSAFSPASISGTGVVSATNIADVTRTIQLSLDDWRTDADPPLEIDAATTPNVSAEGNYDTVEWATGETAQKITTTFVVPADYVSGLSLVVVTAHDGATDDDETLSVSWYHAGDGDADNPTVVNEAATAVTYAQTLSEHTIALDGGTAAAGEVVRVLLGFAAIDETVHVISTRITYTATQ